LVVRLIALNKNFFLAVQEDMQVAWFQSSPPSGFRGMVWFATSKAMRKPLSSLTTNLPVAISFQFMAASLRQRLKRCQRVCVHQLIEFGFDPGF